MNGDPIREAMTAAVEKGIRDALEKHGKPAPSPMALNLWARQLIDIALGRGNLVTQDEVDALVESIPELFLSDAARRW
jgi:hypothetical protein